HLIADLAPGVVDNAALGQRLREIDVVRRCLFPIQQAMQQRGSGWIGLHWTPSGNDRWRLGFRSAVTLSRKLGGGVQAEGVAVSRSRHMAAPIQMTRSCCT